MSGHLPGETDTTPTPQRGGVVGWAVFSLVFSLVLMAGKWFAFYVTGSTAVLSDALESGVNVLTSSFVLFSVWLSSKPRDADHPYGHGKVEFFSAGFEGALILFAALSILTVSIARLISPQPLEELEYGLGIQAVIVVATFAAGYALIRAGRHHNSPSLVADGVHIRADALTTLGAMLGVFLTFWTGAVWIDALAAVGVSVFLGFSGASVVREAVGGLMDEADPQRLERVASVLEQVREPGWLAPHHAKIHNLGSALHIDLHMVFPAYWTLEEAHDISERLERAMREEFGAQTELMLHMESCTPVSCSYCDVSECPIRHAEFIALNRWDGEHIRKPFRHREVTNSGEKG